MTRSKLGAAAAVLFLLASCETPTAAYVEADRATYAAVAPAHRAYVEADATLTAEQRARRLRTLDAWELRIRHAAGVPK